jgi:hypothetical protein
MSTLYLRHERKASMANINTPQPAASATNKSGFGAFVAAFVGTLWGKLVLIAGGLATIFGVVFTVCPDCKPQPTPPASAKITEVLVEEKVMLETYFQRNSWSLDEYSNEEQKNVGTLVTPRLELTGLRDDEIRVTWKLFNADENREVPADWFPRRLLFENPTYRPAQNQDTWSPTMWLAMPNTTGNFSVRLMAWAYIDEKWKLLGTAITEPFRLQWLPPGAGLPPQVPFPPPNPQIPEWYPGSELP